VLQGRGRFNGHSWIFQRAAQRSDLGLDLGWGAVQNGGGELAISKTKKTDSSPLPSLALENPSYRSIERVECAIRGPGRRSRYRLRLWGEMWE